MIKNNEKGQPDAGTKHEKSAGQEKLTIVEVNSVACIKSTGRLVHSIIQGGAAKNITYYATYGRFKKQCAAAAERAHINTIAIGTTLEVLIHVALTRLFDLHGFGSKFATFRFLRKLDQIAPDILQIHNLHGYYINVEMLFRWIKKRKPYVIWCIHDFWPVTGHCTNGDPAGCIKWESGCIQCPQKKMYPESLFLDQSKRNYRRKQQAFLGVKNMTIVANSDYTRVKLMRSYLKAYPIEKISHGIDLAIFDHKPSDFRKKHHLENRFVMLGVATKFVEQKGYRDFLKLSTLIDKNDRIVLVGVSNEQMAQLPENIIGLRETESLEALVQIYSMADVLVNPSAIETFSMVTLECIACHTPVVAYKGGAIAELVPEQCGFCVNNQDFDALFEKIQVVKTRTKAYYSQHCREFAMRYQISAMQQQHYDLYKRVAAGE